MLLHYFNTTNLKDQFCMMETVKSEVCLYFIFDNVFVIHVHSFQWCSA